MRVLMVGDIVGKAGRVAAIEMLPGIKEEYAVDFAIVNAENVAGGVGITPEIAKALLDRSGADVLTLGNHAWGRKEIYPYLDAEPRILRPANYPPGVPGRGYGLFQCSAGAIAVVALQARTFMEPVDDPFRAIDAILEELLPVTKLVFIDFHGEATSEKQALGWYVDGRASAIVGTHTHVQTADERILPGGTAYLTDVGMTGPIDSVIGMRTADIIPRFKSLLPMRFEVADGPAQLCAIVIDLNAVTGKATRLSRIQRPSHRTEASGQPADAEEQESSFPPPELNEVNSRSTAARLTGVD